MMNKFTKIGLAAIACVGAFAAFSLPIKADSATQDAFITSVKKPVLEGAKLQVTGGCFHSAGDIFNARGTVTAVNLSQGGKPAYKTASYNFGRLYPHSQSTTVKMATVRAKAGDKIKVTWNCEIYRTVDGVFYTYTISETAQFGVKAKPVEEKPDSGSETPQPANPAPTPAIVHDLSNGESKSDLNAVLYVSIAVAALGAAYLSYRYIGLPVYQRYVLKN